MFTTGCTLSSLQSLRLQDSRGKRHFGFRSLSWMAAALWCVSLGCARDHYIYGVKPNGVSFERPHTVDASNDLAIGGDHPYVDRIERWVQSPRRSVAALLGKPRVTEAELIEKRFEALEAAEAYLGDNRLSDVHIDLRRYEPREQWERMLANDRISPFWKATGGTLSVLGYALIPRRAFGSDHYDPYTNTLSLNSIDPVKALYEAGEAKQFRQHYFLGTYAVFQLAPLAPLYHHGHTTSDVLTYAMVNGDWELERQLYPVAYGRLGRAAVSETMSVVPYAAGKPFYTTPLMALAGGVVGNATGNWVLKYRSLSREWQTAGKPRQVFNSD